MSVHTVQLFCWKLWERGARGQDGWELGLIFGVCMYFLDGLERVLRDRFSSSDADASTPPLPRRTWWTWTRTPHLHLAYTSSSHLQGTDPFRMGLLRRFGDECDVLELISPPPR
ncbi:hypothetical protein SAICODRAFT_191088 [Saitoella complicata NRRL Y-17804]|nr:uncharacterized protein SAICODRAFT_191088 [Saitoella complicata NRRL Y-17804]ODQ49788.1 hypothetical protein SAICODRAFT_191088 [Saitoella complicata NRRL Y-17804]